MIDAILALWIGFEAYRRKLWRLICVGVLVILYEAADAGIIRVTEWVSMEGILKRLILLALLVVMFLAWRKKQVKLSALIACAVTNFSKVVWSMVFSTTIKNLFAMEDAGPADVAVLAAKQAVFNLVTCVSLLVMLVLILVNLRKLPLEKDC